MPILFLAVKLNLLFCITWISQILQNSDHSSCQNVIFIFACESSADYTRRMKVIIMKFSKRQKYSFTLSTFRSILWWEIHEPSFVFPLRNRQSVFSLWLPIHFELIPDSKCIWRIFFFFYWFGGQRYLKKISSLPMSSAPLFYNFPFYIKMYVENLQLFLSTYRWKQGFCF